MRPGRPPTTAEPGKMTTVTIRLKGSVKNSLIEMADGNDLSISEYLTTLIERDRGETAPTSL